MGPTLLSYDLVDIIPEVIVERWRIGRRTVSSHGSGTGTVGGTAARGLLCRRAGRGLIARSSTRAGLSDAVANVGLEESETSWYST